MTPHSIKPSVLLQPRSKAPKEALGQNVQRPFMTPTNAVLGDWVTFSSTHKPVFEQYNVYTQLDVSKYMDTCFPNSGDTECKEKALFTALKEANRLELGIYSTPLLPRTLTEKVNQLGEDQARAVVDVGSNKVKLLWAQKNKDLHVLKVSIPQFKRLEQHQWTSDAESELQAVVDVLKAIARCQGVDVDNPKQFQMVATEGLRRYEPLYSSKIPPEDVTGKVRAFRQKNQIAILSPREESRLQRLSMVHNLPEDLVQRSITMDVGGGSSDGAYIDKNQGIPVFKSLNIPIGHNWSQKLPDTFSQVQLFAMKKPIQVLIQNHQTYQYNGDVKHQVDKALEPIQNQLKALKIDTMIIGMEYGLVKYVQQHLNRSILASDPATQPLTKADIDNQLLSQEALNQYKKLSKSDPYFKKLPMHLLILSELMEALDIDRLLVGSPGGLKVTLMDQFLSNGPVLDACPLEQAS